MHELITKNWNNFQMEFEMVDGHLMANATGMCAAFGKRAAKWLELESTKRYINALEAKSEIRTSLVETRTGGTGGGGGTWIHERLILKLAAWLDVSFEIQCDEWIAELLRTGKVEVQPAPAVPAVPQSQAELILMIAQQNVETERRISSIEQQVTEVQAHLTTVNTDYYTVAGFAALQRRRLSPQEANTFGRQAASLSRQMGFEVTKVHDSRYGQVNNYHKQVLQQIVR